MNIMKYDFLWFFVCFEQINILNLTTVLF